MTSMQHWTTDQWAVFSLTLGFGTVAVALAVAAVRTWHGWTAPAVRRAVTLTPSPLRPSLILTAAKRRLSNAQMADAIRGPAKLWPIYDVTGELVGVPTAPELVAHLAPGPGSLTSLAAAKASLTREVLVDQDVREAVGAALDRVLAEFRAAVEPAMRKARRWELAGHAGESAPWARVALDHWRIDEPTGEHRTIALATTGSMG